MVIFGVIEEEVQVRFVSCVQAATMRPKFGFVQGTEVWGGASIWVNSGLMSSRGILVMLSRVVKGEIVGMFGESKF